MLRAYVQHVAAPIASVVQHGHHWTARQVGRLLDNVLGSEKLSAMVMVLPVVIAITMLLCGISLHGLISNVENLVGISGASFWAVKFARRCRGIDLPGTSVSAQDECLLILDPNWRLRKLQELRDDDLLTEEEYEVKRAEVIKSI
jgi:hypothetical protein